jgi:hypothetical protein
VRFFLFYSHVITIIDDLLLDVKFGICGIEIVIFLLVLILIKGVG